MRLPLFYDLGIFMTPSPLRLKDRVAQTPGRGSVLVIIRCTDASRRVLVTAILQLSYQEIHAPAAARVAIRAGSDDHQTFRAAAGRASAVGSLLADLR